jgi:hypothetical protein
MLPLEHLEQTTLADADMVDHAPLAAGVRTAILSASSPWMFPRSAYLKERDDQHSKKL